MKLKLLLLIAVVMSFLIDLKAQDAFHYTMFDHTQVAMNPSLAGNFEGTVRIGGLFREQDYGLAIGQYRNPVVFADAPIIKGFGKYHWLGMGVSYLYDVQRYDDVNLITNKIFGGVSYHIGFDKKYKNVLSFGIQSGTTTSYFSSPDITVWTEFGDDPQEDPAEAALPIKNPPNGGSGGSVGGGTNWIGGVSFKSQISNDSKLLLGVSVANIGRVNNSIIGQSGYNRAPLRFLVHGQYYMPLVEKVTLEPRVFFQYLQPSWDFSLQTKAHFLMRPESNLSVHAGLGYNVQNGLQFLVGFNNDSFDVGFSFDLNLSDKTAVSGPAAAFELGAAYKIKFYKKPNPDPVLTCPRI